jgi:hypothetical protein
LRWGMGRARSSLDGHRPVAFFQLFVGPDFPWVKRSKLLSTKLVVGQILG